MGSVEDKCIIHTDEHTRISQEGLSMLREAAMATRAKEEEMGTCEECGEFREVSECDGHGFTLMICERCYQRLRERGDVD